MKTEPNRTVLIIVGVVLLWAAVAGTFAICQEAILGQEVNLLPVVIIR